MLTIFEVRAYGQFVEDETAVARKTRVDEENKGEVEATEFDVSLDNRHLQ